MGVRVCGCGCSGVGCGGIATRRRRRQRQPSAAAPGPQVAFRPPPSQRGEGREGRAGGRRRGRAGGRREEETKKRRDEETRRGMEKRDRDRVRSQFTNQARLYGLVRGSVCVGVGVCHGFGAAHSHACGAAVGRQHRRLEGEAAGRGSLGDQPHQAPHSRFKMQDNNRGETGFEVTRGRLKLCVGVGEF